MTSAKPPQLPDLATVNVTSPPTRPHSPSLSFSSSPQLSTNNTMSTPAPAPLPTGAYIIRNRETSTVLHAQSSEIGIHDATSVLANQQDEGQFKDQQIWWVEPLADYAANSSKSLVYSITSPGSGKALEANPESGIHPAERSRGRC